MEDVRADRDQRQVRAKCFTRKVIDRVFATGNDRVIALDTPLLTTAYETAGVGLSLAKIDRQRECLSRGFEAEIPSDKVNRLRLVNPEDGFNGPAAGRAADQYEIRLWPRERISLTGGREETSGQQKKLRSRR